MLSHFAKTTADLCVDTFVTKRNAGSGSQASEEKVAPMFISAWGIAQVRGSNFWRCLSGGGGFGPAEIQQILHAEYKWSRIYKGFFSLIGGIEMLNVPASARFE